MMVYVFGERIAMVFDNAHGFGEAFFTRDTSCRVEGRLFNPIAPGFFDAMEVIPVATNDKSIPDVSTHFAQECFHKSIRAEPCKRQSGQPLDLRFGQEVEQRISDLHKQRSAVITDSETDASLEIDLRRDRL